MDNFGPLNGELMYKLKNTKPREDGIFGTLTDDKGTVLAVTLTHAYLQPDGTFKGKTPAGTYTCKRGNHRLHSMTHDFETFEIMNVPNHVNILFHWGNFNRDSDGCFLLGEHVVTSPVDKKQMITDSKKAFNAFMAGLVGVDEFELTVS